MIVGPGQRIENLLRCHVPNLDAKLIEGKRNQVAEVLSFSWAGANSLQRMVALS